MFEFRRQRRSLREFASPLAHERSVDAAPSRVPAFLRALSSRNPSPSSVSSGDPPSRGVPSRGDALSAPRELPDVTGFMVVVLVTLGLFVVPVGATIMQGPAIVASLLGR